MLVEKKERKLEALSLHFHCVWMLRYDKNIQPDSFLVNLQCLIVKFKIINRHNNNDSKKKKLIWLKRVLNWNTESEYLLGHYSGHKKTVEMLTLTFVLEFV